MSRMNLSKLFFRIIMLFPIVTLFATYFNFLNKALFGISTVMLIVLVVFLNIERQWKNTKMTFVVFILFLLSYVYALAVTKLPFDNLNDIFYFPFATLFFYYCSMEKENLKKHLVADKTYILNIIRIWCFLVLVSIFLPSSYNNGWSTMMSSQYKSGWGVGNYFGSFTGSIFRLAPPAVFILTLIIFLMIIEKKRIHAIWSLVPMYCFFMGGSRIYLAIGLMLFIMIWYLFINDNRKFYFSLIPLIGIFSGLVFVSTIKNKLQATLQSQQLDFMDALSNGRSVFWNADIAAIYHSSFIGKIVGNGFNFVYDVNEKAVGSRIWAHNDFIQILPTSGIFGLITYAYVFYLLFNHFIGNPKKINKLFLILSIFSWFMNAFFNMFYTYINTLISFPVLLLAISLYKTSKSDKVGSKKNLKIKT